MLAWQARGCGARKNCLLSVTFSGMSGFQRKRRKISLSELTEPVARHAARVVSTRGIANDLVRSVRADESGSGPALDRGARTLETLQEMERQRERRFVEKVVVPRALELWRRGSGAPHWQPVEGVHTCTPCPERGRHQCSERCAACVLVHLETRVYAHGGATIADADRAVAAGDGAALDRSWHVCVRGECRRWQQSHGAGWELYTLHSRRQTLVPLLRDGVWVCRRTGRAHLCTEGYCELMFLEHNVDPDHHHVCPLTGFIASGTQVISHLQDVRTGSTQLAVTYRALSKVFDDTRPNSEFARVSETTGARLRGVARSGTLTPDEFERNMRRASVQELLQNASRGLAHGELRCEGGQIPHKLDYLLVAYSRVRALLDMDQLRQRRTASQAAVVESMTKLKRHTTICDREGRMPNAFDMLLIVLNVMATFPEWPHLEMTDEMHREMCMQFARQCVCLWYLLVTRTPHGPRTIVPWFFGEFVESAMMLLRNGFGTHVMLNELGHVCRLVLVPPNQLLRLIMPEKPLDFDQALHRRQRRTNRNQILNAIHVCLLESVRMVPAASLILANLDFDQLDLDVFEKHPIRRAGQPLL